MSLQGDTTKKSFLYRRPLLILISIFLLIQFLLFLKSGVYMEMEASKYIEQGRALLHTGSLTESKYIFYLPVILLVFIFEWLGLPLQLIAIFQIGLAAYALCCFYRMTLRLSSGRVALFSSILLAIFVPLQHWNLYLYSDSIFISLSIIFVCRLQKYPPVNIRNYLLLAGFLAMLVFSRPNGMLLIPPFIIFCIFYQPQPYKYRLLHVLSAVVSLVLIYLLANIAFTGGGELDILKPFIEEHIICFVPTADKSGSLDLVHSSNPLSDFGYYITHNTSHFLQLTGRKLISFFDLTRPYYSDSHNMVLYCFFIPVYLFLIPGLYRLLISNRNFFVFLLALLTLYPLGISMQCDDWHSRFTMVVIPYLIFLAVYGIEGLWVNKILKRS